MAKDIFIAHVKLNVILKGVNVLKQGSNVIQDAILHCHVIISIFLHIVYMFVNKKVNKIFHVFIYIIYIYINYLVKKIVKIVLY